MSLVSLSLNLVRMFASSGSHKNCLQTTVKNKKKQRLHPDSLSLRTQTDFQDSRSGLFVAWLVLLTLIHWIAIYPVDSVIQLSNNWEGDLKRKSGKVHRFDFVVRN